MTPEQSVGAARDALWRWFCFEEWENVDLDAMTDEQFERIDTISRDLFGAFCDVLGHELIDDMCRIPEHRFCIYCLEQTT